jgi:hypothetical protein
MNGRDLFIILKHPGLLMRFEKGFMTAVAAFRGVPYMIQHPLSFKSLLAYGW